MNVYEVRHDSDCYEWLVASGTDGGKWLDFTRFKSLGEYLAPEWAPLRFRSPSIDAEDYPVALPKGDFVALGTLRFALAPRAMTAVGGLMSRYGELLPIEHIGHPDPLYWFHCTTIIDAMDESLSCMRRFPDGKVSNVDRLWVYPEKLSNAMLYHIPQNGSFLLCTDTFKQHIEALGLTGLKFVLKWSDEPAGMKYISSREPRELYKMPPFPVSIP